MDPNIFPTKGNLIPGKKLPRTCQTGLCADGQKKKYSDQGTYGTHPAGRIHSERN